MAQRMIGVDLGATAIRVAEISGVDRDEFAVVTRMSIVPLPDSSKDDPWIVAGRIANPQGLAAALAKAFSEAGVPRYGFVLGHTSKAVAVATTRLPGSVKTTERVQAIRNAGKEISPLVPLAQAELGVNFVRSDKTAEDVTWDTLTVGAALSEEVAKLNALCKLAKLTPRAIDLSGVALTRALVRTSADAREVATVVDIGATKTTVVTRRGRHVRSIRTVTTGGVNITRALQSVAGESFEDAELRKKSLRLTAAVAEADPGLSYGAEDAAELLDDKTRTKIEGAFNEAGEELVNQIATSVEFDAEAHGSFTEGVSLTGGTALLLGLKERLQQRLGVPVQVGRPWATILPHKRNLAYKTGGKDDPVVLQQLATAVGLALWKEPV